MSLRAIGDEELLDYVIEKDFEDTVARVILGAVSIFDEGVGKVKLSRVLRGKDPGFVISRKPEARELYGKLRILDEDQTLDFIESLIRLSLLDLEDPEFPRLRITRKGERALVSSKLIPVMIPWPLPAKEIPIPVDEPMYERLREVRNRLAREEGLPPYCVASNLSLVELINRGITSVDALETVPGIGPGRSEKYGSRLLEVLEG